MMEDKRIRIIIGHYGSGKTEFAVNYAIALAKEKKKVALADLDVVNPYFRSREKQQILEHNQVILSASYLKGEALDLPAVTGDILGPLQDEGCQVVLDVGGNDVGARALARFKAYFVTGQYDMFCVVNANRPETETVEGVIAHIQAIEKTTGIAVTGLINNTHLLRETTIEDVLKGQRLCELVSSSLQLPISYIGVLEELVPALPEKLKGSILPIRMIMRETWM